MRTSAGTQKTVWKALCLAAVAACLAGTAPADTTEKSDVAHPGAKIEGTAPALITSLVSDLADGAKVLDRRGYVVAKSAGDEPRFGLVDYATFHETLDRVVHLTRDCSRQIQTSVGSGEKGATGKVLECQKSIKKIERIVFSLRAYGTRARSYDATGYGGYIVDMHSLKELSRRVGELAAACAGETPGDCACGEKPSERIPEKKSASVSLVW